MAFAVVATGEPGRFYAVRLHNVVAERVEHLVPGKDRATIAALAVQRCERAMEIMRAKRQFGG